MSNTKFALLIAAILAVAAMAGVGVALMPAPSVEVQAPEVVCPEVKCPPVFMEGAEGGSEPSYATTGTGFEPIGRFQELQIDADSDQKGALLIDQGGSGPSLQIAPAGDVNTQILDDGSITTTQVISSAGGFYSEEGYAAYIGTEGQTMVAWTDNVTGTATVAHGLTTVTWAVCSLGRDPDADAGDAAHVTLTVSANVVTAKVWQDDFVTAATETDIPVHCLVIGAP